MKGIHLLISILFLSFAITQWNDGDAILWILMYSSVSIVAFLAFKGIHQITLNATLAAIFMVLTIYYIPHLQSWVDDSMPSITETMQASTPYIELVREGLGIILSLIAMIYFLLIAKKVKQNSLV